MKKAAHSSLPQFTSLSCKLAKRSCATTLLAGIATILVISQSAQAVVSLTFDLRATQVNGVAAADAKSVTVGSAGDVVTLQLFAIVNGVDNNQANDGFLAAAGSFVSSGSNGGSRGTWGALGANPANGDVDPLFRGTGSQNGTLAATDANFGGFDLGRDNGASDTSIPSPNPYFQVSSNTNNPVFGAGAGNSVQFLLGTKTFTIAELTASPITLNFVGRTTSALSKPNKWTVDGVSKSLSGNAVADIAYGASVIIAVPEPSAFGMIALGALSMVGFRRFGLRRK